MAARNKKSSQLDYHSPAYHKPFVPLGPRPPVTEEGTRIAREVRLFANKLGAKTPSRAWAPRLLERAASGEHICYRGVELAREVVVMDAPVLREPGSDDE